MSEIETLGTAGLGVYAVKKIADGFDRVFGPMANEIAEALRRWTEHRLRNVGRVVENADSKTSESQRDWSISHRSAVKLTEEAAVSDDEIVVDYVGGVLASARSPEGDDDRSVPWAAFVGRLSVQDLQAHYALYSTFSRLLHGKDINVHDRSDMRKNALAYIGYDEYFACTGWIGSADELEDLFSGSIYTLIREDLIELLKAGEPSHLQIDYPEADKSGLLVWPTVHGIRLALWAQGRGRSSASSFVETGSPKFHIDGKKDVENATLVRLDSTNYIV